MALCPGLPGWANTRREIHPLTHEMCHRSGFMRRREDNGGKCTDNPAGRHLAVSLLCSLLFSVYLFYVAAMFVRDRRWPQPGSPVRGPWLLVQRSLLFTWPNTSGFISYRPRNESWRCTVSPGSKWEGHLFPPLFHYPASRASAHYYYCYYYYYETSKIIVS